VLGEPAVDHGRELLDVLDPERFDDLDDHQTRVREHAMGDGGLAGQVPEPDDRLVAPVRGEDPHG
jgi:hypothetical protein